MYNLQDLCHITRRREKKTSGNEGLDGKNGKKICFFLVILYYNDLVVGFQKLIAACEKQILRSLLMYQGFTFLEFAIRKSIHELA